MTADFNPGEPLRQAHTIARAAQDSLFGDAVRTILAGPSGTVTYYPSCIDAETAKAWFTELRDTIAWRAERRRMYEREVDVPRLYARFSVDDTALPAPVVTAARVVRELTGDRFNSAGLNYYRDGRDSVAPHNDKLHNLVTGRPISIVSLGAVRRFVIRTKAAPKRTTSIDLESGSLLVMDYQTQLHLDHGIPKVQGAVAGRISITFRTRAD
jgi:alkylated DNA repair dioxygenase AlkB